MKTLKEQMKEIYREKQLTIPLEEEEILENFKKIKSYYEREKNELNSISVDKIINVVLKHFLNPKNVEGAIRIPLNIRRYNISERYSHYLGGNYYVQLSNSWVRQNVHPVLIGKAYSSTYPDYVLKNPNEYKRKKIKEELDKLQRTLRLDYFETTLNSLGINYENKMIEKIKDSGIKYSIKTSKNGDEKWILLNISKTKPEKVSEEFLGYYNKLKTAFYGG